MQTYKHQKVASIFTKLTRQLKKRVKEHIPACIDKFLDFAEKEKLMMITTVTI